MVILLDLDGVLITTPAWRAVETEPDGFFKFNARATTNLAAVLAATNAAVVLTTSHRLKYSLAQWSAFFYARGLVPAAITKVNDRTTLPPAGSRAAEIVAWVAQPGAPANRCVITKPLLGLDADAAQRALHILRSHPAPTLPC